MAKRRHLVTSQEKKAMQKISVTGENIEVQNHDQVVENTPIIDPATPQGMFSNDLSKEKSEISKLALYLIGLIIVLIIIGNILAILFRPEAIKTSGDLLTIIIPITITGLLGFLSGLAIGRKMEK